MATRGRAFSASDDLRSLRDVCRLSIEELADDLYLKHVDDAASMLEKVIASHGNIFFWGNGFGSALAQIAVGDLSSASASNESPTRSCLLGCNPVMSTTRFGKTDTAGALDAELSVLARYGDAVVMVVGDLQSQAALNLAERARRRDLDLSLILLSYYPGAPVARFANVKILAHCHGELLSSRHCMVSTIHLTLVTLCGHLKRAAGHFRRSNSNVLPVQP